VLPVPVLRLLGRGPGGPSAGEVAAGAAGGTLLGGAGVKLAVACLASLACGGALYAGLDRPHAPPPKTTAQAQTPRTQQQRKPTRDRPTRAAIPTPAPSQTSSRSTGSKPRQRSGTSSTAQDAPRQAPEFSFETAASKSPSTTSTASGGTQSASPAGAAQAPSPANPEFGFER
jgi:hypothetical protein